MQLSNNNYCVLGIKVNKCRGLEQKLKRKQIERGREGGREGEGGGELVS